MELELSDYRSETASRTPLAQRPAHSYFGAYPDIHRHRPGVSGLNSHLVPHTKSAFLHLIALSLYLFLRLPLTGPLRHPPQPAACPASQQLIALWCCNCSGLLPTPNPLFPLHHTSISLYNGNLHCPPPAACAEKEPDSRFDYQLSLGLAL